MSTSTLNPFEAALQALQAYRPGASRGDLLPIDEAVRLSLDDPERRGALEERLLSALDQASLLGQVYLLKQLARVGTERSIPKIIDCLTEPETADEACRTLAVLPPRAAAAALRVRLPQLERAARIGAIHVLGRVRDALSVEPLEGWCAAEDAGTAGAALTALGRIATPDAAEVLQRRLAGLPETLRKTLTEAAMDCVDGLRAAGHLSAAQGLADALAKTK